MHAIATIALACKESPGVYSFNVEIHLKMRRAIFVFFVMFGAAVGLFASLGGTVGLKIVMSGFGALAGAALGGAFYRGRGNRRSAGNPDDHDTANAERMDNHWLDRGRPTAAPGLPHADDSDPFSPEP